MLDHAAPDRPSHKHVVWLGLGIAILLDSATQLVWKQLVMRLPGGKTPAMILDCLHQPLLALLIALMLIQFFNWMFVISRSDVSYAQPITAASYVSVTFISHLYLGERLSALRVVALGLILAGVWLIGTTPLRTMRAPAGRPPRDSRATG